MKVTALVFLFRDENYSYIYCQFKIPKAKICVADTFFTMNLMRSTIFWV